jgi:hypothetical protein
MSVRTPEVLTPDGDGDEQRGIEQAELHANYSNPDGSLRTTESRGPVRESVDSPVRGVKAMTQIITAAMTVWAKMAAGRSKKLSAPGLMICRAVG